LSFSFVTDGCPVPRLTLLFFDAAKGYSGSSKNGHRRDNRTTFFHASRKPETGPG